MKSDLAHFPPVYVISLARSQERRASIRPRLDALGVAYEIVDAVDGTTLDLSQYTDRLCLDKYRIKFGRAFSSGEIGCFLSHYVLWERMVAEKSKIALILEDDAVWDDDFTDVIMRLLTIEWQWDLVLLSAGNNRPINCILCNVSDNRRLVRHKRRAWTTAAYLIRLSAAEKLLPYCREIRAGIDVLYSEYWKNDVDFYFVDPPPARQSDAETSIAEKAWPPRNLTERALGSLRRKMDRWQQFFYCRRHPPRKYR